MARSKRDHHYSGPNSVGIWNRINKLKGAHHASVYSMACILQDLEERVLISLDNAEKDAAWYAKQKKVKKAK